MSEYKCYCPNCLKVDLEVNFPDIDGTPFCPKCRINVVGRLYWENSEQDNLQQLLKEIPRLRHELQTMEIQAQLYIDEDNDFWGENNTLEDYL